MATRHARRRDVGAGGRSVALLVEALARDRDAGRAGAQRPPRRPRRDERPRLDAPPAPAGCAPKPAGEQRGARRGRPQAEHDSDVGVGGAGLGEQVVAVVPPGDEPEVVHRGERRRTGADDDLDVPPQHLEPRGVARLRPLVGGEPHVPPLAEQPPSARRRRGRRRGGRDDEERAPPAASAVAAATARAAGQSASPVRRRAARATTPRGPRPRRRGAGTPDRRDSRPGGPGPGARGSASAPAARGPGLLRGGVPRRHGQAQHVAERAGVAGGDGAAQRQHARGEHRLGRDHPAQRRQPAVVLGLLAWRSTTNPSRSWPANRTLTRAPGTAVVGERVGHERTRTAVEVGQTGVDRPTRPGRCQRHRRSAAGRLGRAARISSSCSLLPSLIVTEPAGRSGRDGWTPRRG